MQKSNKETLYARCQEEIMDSFTGKLYSINRFEYDSYMNETFFNLTVKISSDSNCYKEYQYHIKGNQELLNFIMVGDSVIKNRNEWKISIVKPSSIRQDFKLPSCNEDK